MEISYHGKILFLYLPFKFFLICVLERERERVWQNICLREMQNFRLVENIFLEDLNFSPPVLCVCVLIFVC